MGNYSRSLIESLARFFPENKYLLYTPKATVNEATRPLLQGGNIAAKVPTVTLWGTIWRTFLTGQLKKDGIALYHGLSHELPLGIEKSGIKSVVTIHDLIFIRYPHYYPLLDRIIYQKKCLSACRRADAIIAISQQTKRDIVAYLDIPEDKIKVVYQTCHPVFERKANPEALEAVREKYRLPGKYILNVGTIEERKNILTLVKTLPLLPADVAIVAVGKRTRHATTIEEWLAKNSLQDRVMFLHDVPFQDLPAIYQNAAVFAYPSEFEGFGIPVIEALKSGVPVVAASGSCLEEAGGHATVYAAHHDVAAWARAINSILANAQQQESMKEEGLRYAAKFSEENHARETMQVYTDLLSQS
ncbi:MAG: glycosyltransferase family 1 protein [Edaphocola sp.]